MEQATSLHTHRSAHFSDHDHWRADRVAHPSAVFAVAGGGLCFGGYGVGRLGVEAREKRSPQFDAMAGRWCRRRRLDDLAVGAYSVGGNVGGTGRAGDGCRRARHPSLDSMENARFRRSGVTTKRCTALCCNARTYWAERTFMHKLINTKNRAKPMFIKACSVKWMIETRLNKRRFAWLMCAQHALFAADIVMN